MSKLMTQVSLNTIEQVPDDHLRMTHELIDSPQALAMSPHLCKWYRDTITAELNRRCGIESPSPPLRFDTLGNRDLCGVLSLAVCMPQVALDPHAEHWLTIVTKGVAGEVAARLLSVGSN